MASPAQCLNDSETTGSCTENSVLSQIARKAMILQDKSTSATQPHKLLNREYGCDVAVHPNVQNQPEKPKKEKGNIWQHSLGTKDKSEAIQRKSRTQNVAKTQKNKMADFLLTRGLQHNNKRCL